MVEKIYSYLNNILNKPICSIGRASNMLCIGIGATINVSDRNGNNVKRSMFSLHVQSTWRITDKEKGNILLASSDFYSPNSKISVESDFNWDIQGINLFDEKSQIWLKNSKPIYVNEYKINKFGDLLLIFSNSERLEIFVNSSDDTECWRLFKCNCNEEHLVITGLGVDFQ